MIKISEKESVYLLKMKVSEFLQEESRAAELLKKIGMDIRNNEEKSLMELCTAQQLNESEVLREISNIRKRQQFMYPSGIFSWSPELVIKYLVEEHHQFTRLLIKDATDFEQRACDVHGTQYPELNQVKWYFEKLKNKLNLHLKFEEEKFFPLALKFFDMAREPHDGIVQSLKKQIKLIQKDQDEIDYLVKRIKTVSNQFTAPENSCTTFNLFYSTLQNLYDDLEKHHFLEEQYVVSKLEEKLKAVQS